MAADGSKSPEAGAPEIEVTPEMVSRGLATFLSTDLEFEPAEDALLRVLEASLSRKGFVSMRKHESCAEEHCSH